MALDVSYSLLVQFMIAGILGLLASQLWVNQHGGYDLGGTKDTCEGFIEKTKLLKGLKLGTKTPYQFEVEVTDESYMHSCQAVQVRAHGIPIPVSGTTISNYNVPPPPPPPPPHTHTHTQFLQHCKLV